ncbi:ABC transporter permease subunit [Bacillus massilinigeriensis]|uniref:ABC transporter permease subunit n=1 Tax=Bacillus mediterraneensis TaxID=1805474 RepID=UPI0008F8197A|nr:ABC transporter permease subunit [Bacillus mediterraneensis]
MNIVRRESKANAKSLILWSVGSVIMVATGMAKYAGMAGSGDSMNKLVASMPKSLQAIMGTASFDLSKASGYYGLLFLYLLVMGTIHAAMLGAGIIAKEERDKTAEFLFAKPVSRTKALSEKLLAAVGNLLIFNAVTLLSSIAFIRMYGNGERFEETIVLLMAALLFGQLLFLSLGAFIAAILKRPSAAGACAAGMLLFTFLLSIAVNMKEELHLLRYLTPFQYFEASKIMDAGLDPVFISLSLFLTVGFTTLAYYFYNRKDLGS